MKKISPSILDVKKDELVNYVSTLISWGVSNIHYDVMDNIFVPNVALEYKEIEKIYQKAPRHTMDIHLMVKDVLGYYEMYKNIADIITFHFEAISLDDLNSLIIRAKNDNKKLGLAIKPNTKIEKILPYIKYFSLILIMSVEPGFGGQKFIQSSYDKIFELKKYIKNNKLETILEIDGGVNLDNIKYCFDAGIDLAVVGSYLVKNFSKETIDKLLN
ncbi:ribulose-phosphate 3-epimerase [Metamycoplasma buccale]|uniref:ribulose-phosphate 3-epimerase n=1 Tax=Metamycoplasma buccale TaxID=55602 RepID=UPI00398EA456